MDVVAVHSTEAKANACVVTRDVAAFVAGMKGGESSARSSVSDPLSRGRLISDGVYENQSGKRRRISTIPNHNSYFSYFNPTRSSHDLPAESHGISQTQSFEGGFHPFTEKPPSIAST